MDYGYQFLYRAVASYSNSIYYFTTHPLYTLESLLFLQIILLLSDDEKFETSCESVSSRNWLVSVRKCLFYSRYQKW